MKTKILLILISFLTGCIISSYITNKVHYFLLRSGAVALWGIANKEKEKGNFEGAIYLLYQAMGRYPKESLVYLALGDIFFQLKRYDMAEEMYKILLTLDSNYSSWAKTQLQRIREEKMSLSKPKNKE